MRALLLLLLFIAACAADAQPAGRPGTGDRRRIWAIHTTQRYQTAGNFVARDGGVAWYESAVGISGGLFLPGPGLLRAGADYIHTRFAFASNTRLGLSDSDLFRHVQEVRLFAQLLTPWSSTWSSQLFGAVTSGFESGAAPDDALSGLAGLGVTRRFSDRLSFGLGGLLLHPMGSQAVTVVPIVLLDWQMTERLALRSRQDITLSYRLDPRRRLSVAAVASFFDRKQFRLDETGTVPAGVAEFKGLEVGGRVVWEPSVGLTVHVSVEAARRRHLRVEDRAGRELVDLDLEDALRLSLAARYRF